MLSGIQIVESKHKDSRYFFQLLISLIQKYFKALQNDELKPHERFDHKALIEEFISRLVNYNSNERKGGLFT